MKALRRFVPLAFLSALSLLLQIPAGTETAKAELFQEEEECQACPKPQCPPHCG